MHGPLRPYNNQPCMVIYLLADHYRSLTSEKHIHERLWIYESLSRPIRKTTIMDPLSPQPIRLSDTINLYRPDSTKESTAISHGTGPEMIILCTWFRALPKHIAKYIHAHRQRYPQAQILVIESVVGDMMYTPYSVQRERLSSVVDIIKGLASTNQEILLHIFSNGGSNSAVQLAEAWHSSQSSPFPATSMVLDSCPGSPSLKLAADAVVSSSPKSSYWWVVIFAWTVVVPFVAFPSLLGGPNVVALLRERLNDARLFSARTKRVYICSSTDLMVPQEDVVRHLESARLAGYDATLVEIDGSAHVSHVMKDPSRYWSAVEDVRAR
jgi:hypothetical protein